MNLCLILLRDQESHKPIWGFELLEAHKYSWATSHPKGSGSNLGSEAAQIRNKNPSSLITRIVSPPIFVFPSPSFFCSAFSAHSHTTMVSSLSSFSLLMFIGISVLLLLLWLFWWSCLCVSNSGVGEKAGESHEGNQSPEARPQHLRWRKWWSTHQSRQGSSFTSQQNYPKQKWYQNHILIFLFPILPLFPRSWNNSVAKPLSSPKVSFH